MIAGTFNGVQASSGSGPWTTVLNPSLEMNFAEAGNNYILGSYKYFSWNGGTTWQVLLPSGELAFSDVDISTGMGYVICGDSRLYRLDIGVWATTQDLLRTSTVFRYDVYRDALILEGFDIGTLVQVFDTSGRILMNGSSGSDRDLLDLTSLPNGSYIARAGASTTTFSITR